MMENINDIAGIRIICANREDIYKILEIVKKIPNFEILDVKYKSDQEISKSDKKKLLECAKLIMKLDKKMSSLYQIK